MKVLYTAFNGKNNSSKILLDKINNNVDKLYLRNSFTTSVKLLKKEIIKNEYDLIISFGQAPLEQDVIKIELYGNGVNSYKTKYNYIILKNLLDKSFKTIISENAGNYLCNNIYYNGLKYIEENNLKTNMIFIHIPENDNISNIDKLSKIFKEQLTNYREDLY